MSPGGKREGAGRKSSWASGVKFSDTTLIRIPNDLKERVLFLAHELDSGREVLGQDQVAELRLKIKHLEESVNTLTTESEALKGNINNLENELVTISQVKLETDRGKQEIDKNLGKSALNKNNEKVTKSNTGEQLPLLDYKSDFSKGLTTTDLAKRFKVSQPMIAKKRKQGEDKFKEYCLIKDPEKFVWRYNVHNKRFYPLEKL